MITPEQLRQEVSSWGDEKKTKRLRTLYESTVRLFYDDLLQWDTVKRIITTIHKNPNAKFNLEDTLQKILTNKPQKDDTL